MTDSSGNARHGTYNNTPVLGVTGLLVGDSDTCVDFTGDDHATGTSMPSTSSRTVECLIRPDAVTGANRSFLDMDDSWGRMFQLRLTSSGYIEFIAWNSTGGIFFATGTTALSAGSTYHVAAVFDHVAGAATIYVNGAVYQTAAVTGTAANNGALFRIGANASSGINAYFDGRIDEVAYYGSALSSTRIAAHYAAATGAGGAPGGTLSAALPVPTVALSGTYSGITAGTLAASLPLPTVALSGTYRRRSGFGLWLDSTATVSAEAPLTPDSETVPLHVVTPTVPTPVLVNGRPS